MPMQTSPTCPIPEAHTDLLLQLARAAITHTLEGDPQWRPDLASLPEDLRMPGACFVTLFTKGNLHGCIGSVKAHQPLAWDVAKNAINAAMSDPRFPALQARDLDHTAIEISILSPLQELSFKGLDHLVVQIQPGEDGVLVEKGWQRGLLLPQVWDKIANPYEFLAHVALKAQSNIRIYDEPDTRVYVFRVFHFTQPAPETKRRDANP